MSASLSDSPHARSHVGTSDAGTGAPPDSDGAGDDVLAQARWPGLEVLLCREDIRQSTSWAIQQPRHTVIIHLAGGMRTLDTEIEGVGATHEAPSPGDIWLVPAGWRYASRAQGGIISYAELRIAPDATVDVPGSAVTILDDIAPRLGHRDEFLYYAMSQLCTLIRRPDDLSAMMAERLQLLLRQHLFRDYRNAGETASAYVPRSPLSPIVARRIDEYIEAHLEDRITLADLSTIAGMGVHRFLVAFRRNFGTTPAQYVLTQRLRRARWRLLNTRDDIADIALACGFSSHSHLSAIFKRETGVSPSGFREGLRTRRTP